MHALLADTSPSAEVNWCGGRVVRGVANIAPRGGIDLYAVFAPAVAQRGKRGGAEQIAAVGVTAETIPITPSAPWIKF